MPLQLDFLPEANIPHSSCLRRTYAGAKTHRTELRRSASHFAREVLLSRRRLSFYSRLTPAATVKMPATIKQTYVAHHSTLTCAE